MKFLSCIFLTLVVFPVTLRAQIDNKTYVSPAKPGEIVLLVLTTVKADKKAEYDRWIKDVLYDALYKTTNPVKKAQLKVTRFLAPTYPNADNTWTYSFLMDPAIPKTNYEIPVFLEQAYGKAKADEYWRQYVSFLAKDVEVFRMQQTDY